MRVGNISLRLVALLAAIMTVMLAFNSLAPAGDDRAQALGDLTGTSCADIYLDVPPAQVNKGDPPGTEDLLVGKSLSRIEPGPAVGQWDITTVTYLGPDQDDNLIPDRPPSDNDCQQKKDHADGTAGANDFQLTPPAGAWNRVVLQIQAGLTKSVAFTCDQDPTSPDPAHVETVAGTLKNPGANPESWSADFAKKCVGTGFPPVIANVKPTGAPVVLANIVGCLVENTKDKTAPAAGVCVPSLLGPKPAGEANRLNELVKYAHVTNTRPTATATLAGNNLVFTTCVFSETMGTWARTDVDTHPLDKTPNAKNFGRASLHLNTTSPPACAPHGPETGAQCANAVDDDGDSDINDGCPAVGVAESGTACGKNAIDNDNDGSVNDGCLANSTTSFNAVLATHARDDTTDNAVLNPATPLDPDGVAGDPVPIPQPPDADSLADDWDGDGCTDWDELSGVFKAGRDPFNPNDCDKNYNGVFNVLAWAAPATKDATGNLVPGQYFHCIAAVVHQKTGGATEPVEASLQCSIDSPALGLLGGSAVPTRADGLAGPPPPPPYNGARPSNLNGEYDTVTNTLSLTGCFPNAGGTLGPNIIVDTALNGKSLKGTATIHGNQTMAACAAKAPNNTGPNVTKIPITVQLTEVADAFDHDKDGCSDWNELKKTAGAQIDRCGDDPYNPYDSDTNFNSISTVQVTVAQADWNKGAGTVIPGIYFHCIADNNPNTGTADPNDFFSRIQCYVDSAVTEVNPQAYAGVYGGGLPGDPPPRNKGPQMFADVDNVHTQLNGVHNKVTNRLLISGCFQNVENGVGPINLGPTVYTSADVDAHTGIGTVQIFTQQTPANCKAGTPVGAPVPGVVEIAEQFSKTGVTAPNQYDTDLDGCTDKQELRPAPAAGGLRDPYNRWDVMDQYTGSPLAKDRIIAVGDIGAVVNRFGTNGSNQGDPLVPPKAGTGYHTSADRAGSMPGSNGWNLKPPDGIVAVGDIGAVVAQFGHSCTT